jgi:hypothetical protein
MQIDMHYYGVYALARTAGLKPKTCQIIATASQFVDDNAANINIEFQDGGRIDAEATAHHISDILVLRDPKDQRQVWVPFHFLPGNEGDSFSERLLCRKDSQLAQAMVKNHLSYAKEDFGAYLMGITAHIYADTFSHYGFSGIGSRRNRVVGKSIEFDEGLEPDFAEKLGEKEKEFFRKYGQGGGFVANMKSWLAETVSGALGHGAVATYPDRPYLKWSFKYEYPKKNRNVKMQRDNPKTFLEGSQALHQMFTQFGKLNQKHSNNDGLMFKTIKSEVAKIISKQVWKEERIKEWKSAANKGLLGQLKFTIPNYDPKNWLQEAAEMNLGKDSKMALTSNLFRFYQAASINRQFVLRELFPGCGLVVA